MSDKIGVIENLLDRVQTFLVGGAMAYTFLRAQGVPVGRSRVEEDKIDLARETLARAAAKRGVRVLLPIDHVAADRPDAGARTEVGRADDFPADLLGRRHRPRHGGRVRDGDRRPRAPCSGTARWASSRSTRSPGARWRSPRRWPRCTGTTVVGGGDSVAALRKAGKTGDVTHVSTGGGASLEFLEGRTLPGLAALEDVMARVPRPRRQLEDARHARTRRSRWRAASPRRSATSPAARS